jgi:small conductance mechanosensitive channel
VLVAFVMRYLAKRVIDRLTTIPNGNGKIPGLLRPLRDRAPDLLGTTVIERRRQRATTIGSVLKSMSTFLVYGLAFVLILGELGINLAPIIASAGVVGVAIGFGAQNLVRDFISGMFMMLEDQYGVGDIVDVGPAKGTVEAVTLRVTRLRDVNGVVWYMRNGEILRIGNESQNWARAILDMPVSYAEDVDKVRSLLQSAAMGMTVDPPWDEIVLEEPSVWGVQALTNEAVIVRVVVKTAPGKQGEVARELRARVKKAFDEAGVSVAPLNGDKSA